VASNTDLVAPARMAIPIPWMISAASGPTRWAARTRSLVRSTMSFRKAFSPRPVRACCRGREAACEDLYRGMALARHGLRRSHGREGRLAEDRGRDAVVVQLARALAEQVMRHPAGQLAPMAQGGDVACGRPRHGAAPPAPVRHPRVQDVTLV